MVSVGPDNMEICAGILLASDGTDIGAAKRGTTVRTAIGRESDRAAQRTGARKENETVLRTVSGTADEARNGGEVCNAEGPLLEVT